MAPTRTRLKLDLDSLFPGSLLEVCGQEVTIKPLGLLKLTKVVRKLKGFGDILLTQGVSFDNYESLENMCKIAVVLLEQFPEVLEECSDIAMEDLEQLPLDVIVTILDKVVEVNMNSKEKLEKSFNALAKRFSLMQNKKDKKNAA